MQYSRFAIVVTHRTDPWALFTFGDCESNIVSKWLFGKFKVAFILTENVKDKFHFRVRVRNRSVWMNLYTITSPRVSFCLCLRTVQMYIVNRTTVISWNCNKRLCGDFWSHLRHCNVDRKRRTGIVNISENSLGFWNLPKLKHYGKTFLVSELCQIKKQNSQNWKKVKIAGYYVAWVIS